MSISFTDPFTGTDGSAPNARWTGDMAGWEINTNHLRFTGAAYSYILATCTAGDNTFSVDTDFSNAAATFGGIVISYTDTNNQAWVLLDASDQIRIGQTVAGVNTTVFTDTGHVRLTAAANLSVSLVGTLVTVTVTGGSDPGTFSQNVAAGSIGGTQVGLAINTGKSADFFDNAVLTGPSSDTLMGQACL